MYKVTLEIADDDMRFLSDRAQLYGEESAAALLQALVDTTIRNERLDAESEKFDRPGWIAFRKVIIRMLEDEYRLAQKVAEKRGLGSPRAALELLVSEAISAASAEDSGGGG